MRLANNNNSVLNGSKLVYLWTVEAAAAFSDDHRVLMPAGILALYHKSQEGREDSRRNRWAAAFAAASADRGDYHKQPASIPPLVDEVHTAPLLRGRWLAGDRRLASERLPETTDLLP
jgi:hypothetical protein